MQNVNLYSFGGQHGGEPGWQADSHGTGAADESAHLILKSEAGSSVSSLVYSPPSKSLKNEYCK